MNRRIVNIALVLIVALIGAYLWHQNKNKSLDPALDAVPDDTEDLVWCSTANAVELNTQLVTADTDIDVASGCRKLVIGMDGRAALVTRDNAGNIQVLARGRATNGGTASKIGTHKVVSSRPDGWSHKFNAPMPFMIIINFEQAPGKFEDDGDRLHFGLPTASKGCFRFDWWMSMVLCDEMKAGDLITVAKELPDSLTKGWTGKDEVNIPWRQGMATEDAQRATRGVHDINDHNLLALLLGPKQVIDGPGDGKPGLVKLGKLKISKAVEDYLASVPSANRHRSCMFTVFNRKTKERGFFFEWGYGKPDFVYITEGEVNSALKRLFLRELRPLTDAEVSAGLAKIREANKSPVRTVEGQTPTQVYMGAAGTSKKPASSPKSSSPNKKK